mmetsp:Transcript_28815/g.83399  ORF Transcript_28815/g.83399 Transcript_28815/m.83399 type:complete len:514 (-) Transcript_28815:428-1969(-)
MQVSKVDQKIGAITFSGYLRMWWTDPRLRFKGRADGGCLDSVVLQPEQIPSVWKPDLYIDNLESEPVYEPSALLEIEPDGKVWYSRELRASVKCTFDLGKLPYDNHTAKIRFASYSQNISKLRLMPKDGVVGPGASGVGISSVALTSNSWTFTADEDGDGFETHGIVEEKFGWDYLTLQFPFRRQYRFFYVEVMFPAMIFLMLAYIQFFVDPKAAPARATLACIPVLIMRTLSNSVYQILPQSAQQMWLADILTALTVMCALVAVEYGIVQFCLMTENARRSRREGLKSNGDVTRNLMAKKLGNGTELDLLLEKVQAQLRSTDELNPTSPSNDGPGATILEPAAGSAAGSGEVRIDCPPSQQGLKQAPSLSKETKTSEAPEVKEHGLLFLKYAAKKFEAFAGADNKLSPPEVRKLLLEFDIYMSTKWVTEVIKMYLLDSGNTNHEGKVLLTFSQFCGLLLDLDKYLLVTKRPTWMGWFQSMSLSQSVDVICRVLWPVALALVLIFFQVGLPYY